MSSEVSFEVAVVAAQLSARVPGGTGRYTAELLRALAEGRPAEGGLSALITAPYPRTLPSGVTTKRMRVPFPGLARLWERGMPPRLGGDVVHAPTLLVPPTARGTRLVVTIHDVVPWTHPETLTPRGVTFHRTMAARAAAQADVLVTPTEAVARRIRELLDPAGQVLAIPPGASYLPTPSDAADRRRSIGAPTTGYLLFVGTAEPRKGLDVLLDALTLPELADVPLVVAGPNGWGDVDVSVEGQRRGLGGRLVVTGRVEDATLAALYAGASALILPSRAEGFGLPVLEAMAAGTPVVVSDDPALIEVGGPASVVTPIGDPTALAIAVRHVIESEEITEGMRRAGRRRAAEFSWTAAAQRFWEMYRDLALGNNGERQGTGM